MEIAEQQRIIAATADYVRQALAQDSSGHDWWHITRVWRLARTIAARESKGQFPAEVDLFVIELAALLHDIADWKFQDGDAEAGSRVARAWLEQYPIDSAAIDHICAIIHDLSFKGAGTSSMMPTTEGMIVQDADRLDALGAIGIGRTFAYGGHTGQPMYDPELAPHPHATFAEYKSARSTTINHFYEKLLLLRDRMHTATARQLAERRHVYMLEFLQRFMDEWDGHEHSFPDEM